MGKSNNGGQSHSEESVSVTKDPQEWNHLVRPILAAIVTAVTGGALIAWGEGAAALGLSMFIFLPAITGFVAALQSTYGKSVIISLLISQTIILIALVMTSLEGIVCVLMASPILFFSALIGAGLGRVVQTNWEQSSKSSVALPVLATLSLVAVGKVENQLQPDYRREVFVTSIVVNSDAQTTWDALIQFDEVTGEIPLLMRLGLPVPESCSMEGEGVGASRTCHFNSGTITERVTRWDPPYHLAFDVEDVKLPGRHWLGFEDAEYTLEPLENGQVRVIRSTTVTSTLQPGTYWRFFEHMGTETEHQYILQSLKSHLEDDAP